MSSAPPSPERIEANFRNGSLTALSVLLGFSLSFLARWASTPGAWSRPDQVAVAAIGLGLVLEVVSIGLLLSVRSLELRRYNGAVRIFLAGLGLVGAGVAIAIFADVLGVETQALRG